MLDQAAGNQLGLPLQAKPLEQPAKSIAHDAISVQVELAIAAGRRRLQSLTLSTKHRGPSRQLLLAFREQVKSAKIEANEFVEVPEPARGHASAIRQRQKLRAIGHARPMRARPAEELGDTFGHFNVAANCVHSLTMRYPAEDTTMMVLLQR